MNWRGHEHVGLIGSKTKHQPLIASALVGFIGLVRAQRNVGRLLSNGIDHGAGVAVKAYI